MIKISAETKAESACKDHELMTSLVPESVGALSIDELIATVSLLLVKYQFLNGLVV